MLILVKMNGLRTYELVGVRLGPTKNAMMQQWHAGQYKVQGDTRLILIRHCLKPHYSFQTKLEIFDGWSVLKTRGNPHYQYTEDAD